MFFTEVFALLADCFRTVFYCEVFVLPFVALYLLVCWLFRWFRACTKKPTD